MLPGIAASDSCGRHGGPARNTIAAKASGLQLWTLWEVALVAAIAATAVVLRVWNLRDVPFNIYPDEVMTGSVAERAYLSGPAQAPVVQHAVE